MTKNRSAEHKVREQMKELQAFFSLSELTEREGITLDELYQELTNLLPKSWQYPEIAYARIVIGDREFCTENFAQSPWRQSAPVEVHGSVVGGIDVGYLKEQPEQDEGPFQKEERRLLNTIAERLGRITERKKAVSALEEKVKDLGRLATVVSDSNDAVILHDLDGKILAWNRGAKEIYGYTEAEALGKNVRDIVAEADREAALTLIQKIKQGEIVKSFELRRVTKDGRILDVWLTTTLLTDETGKPVAIATTERDITERKKTEQSLLESEQRYRTMMEQAGDAVFMYDETGRILDVNLKACQSLGYSREELLSKSIVEIDPKVIQAGKHEFGGKIYLGEQFTFESRHLCKDGSTIPVEVTLGPVCLSLGPAILGIARDITQRKQAEDAQEHNQQLQLQIRDQFLSRMSHELRSPLTPIHQFVTILLDGLVGDLNAEQREYLRIVLRNVNALRTMVSDLLEVTRAESGKLSVDLHCVYLTELIPQILQAFQLANTKDLLISFDVPANLPPVCADPDRVRQILDNLLDNAIKFTPERGGVSVQAQVSNGNPGFLSIAVTDTGRGIINSEQEKIFEYLYQAKNNAETSHRGLGIGLYICKELVSSHGGRIWVESQPGHGSTFFFTLPVFSLEGQIASIVKAANLITHSIALITVEVSHLEKLPLQRIPDQAALRDAWDALQACTLPNLVVLLPRVPHAVSKEFFFIVACVNQSSAEVLAEQLRNQLARCQSLRDYKLDPEVSFLLLDTRSKRNGILAEDVVNKKVVDHIEDLIKTTLHNQGGLYEWTKNSHSG